MLLILILLLFLVEISWLCSLSRDYCEEGLVFISLTRVQYLVIIWKEWRRLRRHGCPNCLRVHPCVSIPSLWRRPSLLMTLKRIVFIVRWFLLMVLIIGIFLPIKYVSLLFSHSIDRTSIKYELLQVVCLFFVYWKSHFSVQ